MGTAKAEYFARLLTTENVKATVQECERLDLPVTEDEETVRVKKYGTTIFAALSKGNGTWICRLNKDYFVE